MEDTFIPSHYPPLLSHHLKPLCHYFPHHILLLPPFFIYHDIILFPLPLSFPFLSHHFSVLTTLPIISDPLLFSRLDSFPWHNPLSLPFFPFPIISFPTFLPPCPSSQSLSSLPFPSCNPLFRLPFPVIKSPFLIINTPITHSIIVFHFPFPSPYAPSSIQYLVFSITPLHQSFIYPFTKQPSLNQQTLPLTLLKLIPSPHFPFNLFPSFHLDSRSFPHSTHINPSHLVLLQTSPFLLQSTHHILLGLPIAFLCPNPLSSSSTELAYNTFLPPPPPSPFHVLSSKN